MDSKTITHLALGGVAGYLLCRLMCKTPLETAVDASKVASDASEKAAGAAAVAADAAVVSAEAAGALSSGTAGYGMGRRYQAYGDISTAERGMENGYARLLGVKNAMYSGTKLNPKTADWLSRVRIGKSRIQYNPDGEMKNVYFANSKRTLDVPFSVYVGSDDEKGHQRFLDLVSSGASVTGAQPESGYRTSWSQAHFDESGEWKGRGYSTLGIKKKDLPNWRTPYQGTVRPRNLAE
jgi:hypothetical protein